MENCDPREENTCKCFLLEGSWTCSRHQKQGHVAELGVWEVSTEQNEPIEVSRRQ